MLRLAIRCVIPLSLLLGACSSRPLPKYEKPVARTRIQHVRTTAYTHTEADHIKHGCSTALGTRLQCGQIHSAAADWSRWPAGSVFRIQETGEVYQVDDYGWALSGTNTIDLYKPTRSAMNKWGVRRVTIENLAWGDVDRSLAILRTRSKYKHVQRMISQIESRYSQLKRPPIDSATAVAQSAPPVQSFAVESAFLPENSAIRPASVATPGPRSSSVAPVAALVPFNSMAR